MWDVTKGIQHIKDAKAAVMAGLWRVVIGDRQVDSAVGSLEAVGREIEVLFGSGAMTGVDVIKVSCLGAGLEAVALWDGGWMGREWRSEDLLFFSDG